MPNLFSTFGRAALVALGLAVAPAAFADADFTGKCPSGSSPIFGSGGGQTLTFNGCQVDCGPGFVATANGNSVTCSQGAPVDTPASGCNLTANPPNNSDAPGTAKDVTLMLTCTAGTTPLALVWSGGTPAGCPTSVNGLANQQLCTIAGVNQNKTWTLSSIKSAGGQGGTNSTNRSAVFTYSAGGGGGGDFTNCPSGSSKISNFYPKVSDTSGDGLGGVGSGAYFSIKMTVPSNANTSINLALKMLGTYGMTGASATWAISETACDVNTPILDMINSNFSKNKLRYMKGYISPNIDASYNYGPAGSQGNATTLSGTRTMEIGKTYYFNIKVDSCPSGYCTIDSLKLP